MSMAKEFREFAVKGNVVDLAVGVIVGAAFGKIIAWTIFIAVKVINRLKREEEKPAAPVVPSAPPRQEVLLEEIRDLLKKG